LLYNLDSHDGIFVSSATIDLSDDTQVSGGVSFSNANYYIGYILSLDGADAFNGTTPMFSIFNANGEVATGAEAEQNILDEVAGGYYWAAYYPLCGIVLRNDGNTGVSDAFLPIDRINRGRSYIWPADFRPRNIAL
jgi:hypothetical protein